MIQMQNKIGQAMGIAMIIGGLFLLTLVIIQVVDLLK
jgi:hypothetical protein